MSKPMSKPNRHPRSRNLPALAALLAWAVAAPAGATSYVSMSDADLAAGSPVIVVGRIVLVEPAAGGSLSATDYVLEVETLVKGSVAGATLVVRLPGGAREDGIALAVAGAPRFAAGETGLFFLVPQGGVFALHQFLLGAFRVGSRSGRPVAWRELGDARAVAVAGRPSPDDGVRDLERFEDWLADLAAGEERSPDYFLPGAQTGGGPVRALRESFFDCPAGLRTRWSAFDGNGVTLWNTHLRGQRGLQNGGFREFTNALAPWIRDPHTPIQFFWFGTTASEAGLARPDARNTALFEDPNDEIGGTFESSGVLALSGTWLDCTQQLLFRGEPFHRIVEGDIVTQDGLYRFLDAQDDPSTAAEELFAHELGHTLGLGHSPRPDALMRAELHNDGRGASLDTDELAGIHSLYGFGELRRPAAPSGLAASVLDSTRVLLTWRGGEENESGFRIERRRRGELNFRFRATTAANAGSYVDGVEPETGYFYRIQAHNGAGRSPYSAIVATEVPEDQRPEPPWNLWSAAVSGVRIRLTWLAKTDPETDFLVEVRSFGGFVRIPVEVPPETRTLEVSGLIPDVDYAFRVRRRNATELSEPSEAVSTTFPLGAGCDPEPGLLCLGRGRFGVRVSWDDGRGGGDATAVPGTDDTGFFWFFGPSNLELLVRLEVPADPESGLTLSHRALSNLGYRISVTDHQTGETEVYQQVAGDLCAPEQTFTFHPTVNDRTPTAEISSPDSPTGEHALRGAALRASASRGAGECAGATPLLSETIARGEGLCLEGRFAVEMSWHDSDGEWRVGRPAARLGASGFFSFTAAGAPEVAVKVLDGRGVNERFWVFASGFAGPEHTLLVTDTATGETRRYHRFAGTRCGLIDGAAFLGSF